MKVVSRRMPIMMKIPSLGPLKIGRKRPPTKYLGQGRQLFQGGIIELSDAEQYDGQTEPIVADTDDLADSDREDAGV